MALPPVLDEENLYKFRTKICERYVKQGKCEFADKCQYSHDLRWTRRPPWKYTYSPELCRDLVFVTDGRGRTIAKSNCKQKRNCRYAHTKEEQMYHPKVYKTAMCHQFEENGWCDRYYCPFAHLEAELRLTEQAEDNRRTFSKPAVQEALCPDIYLPSDRPHPRLRARFLAIMDGIPSQNHLHLALEPSYLSNVGGTRTRQPYTEFISSHTPHSVLSESSPVQPCGQQKEAASSGTGLDVIPGAVDGAMLGNRVAKNCAHQLPTSRHQSTTKEAVGERRNQRTTSRLVQLLQAKQYAENTTEEVASKPIPTSGSLATDSYQTGAPPVGPRTGITTVLTANSDTPPYGSAYASTHSAASAQQWTSMPGSPSANRAHVAQPEFSRTDGFAKNQNTSFDSFMAAALLPHVFQPGERHPNLLSTSCALGATAIGTALGTTSYPVGGLETILARAESWLGHQQTKLQMDALQPGTLPSCSVWSNVDSCSAKQLSTEVPEAKVAGKDFRVKCLTSDICYWNEPIGRSRDDPSVLVYAGLVLGPGKTREVVAVKQLPVVVLNRAGELWREVQRFLTIKDPHHVNIKRAFLLPGEADEGTSLWVVMEKCQGSIVDMFAAGAVSPSFLQAAFPPTGLNGLLHYLLRAIQTLHHQSQSAHMRIHPGNVMIGCNGGVKLGDCAGKIRYLSILDLLHAGIQGATNAKALLQWILGTPQETCWMAPEFLTSLVDLDEELSQALWQCGNPPEEGRSEKVFLAVARNFRWPADFLRRADAWSAGATLFYIASGGLHPYGTPNDPLILANILADKKLNFDKLNNCPWLADLLAGLLCHKPAQRLSVTQALHHPLFWKSEDIEKYLEDLRAALEQPRSEQSARLQDSLSYSTTWVESLACIPSPIPLLPLLLSYMALPSASPQLLGAHPLQSASSFLVFLAYITRDKRIALVERRLIVSECLMAHAAPFLHSVYLFLFPRLTNDRVPFSKSSMDCLPNHGYGWHQSVATNAQGSNNPRGSSGDVLRSAPSSTRPSIQFAAPPLEVTTNPNTSHNVFQEGASISPIDTPEDTPAVPPPSTGPGATGVMLREILKSTWGDEVRGEDARADLPQGHQRRDFRCLPHAGSALQAGNITGQEAEIHPRNVTAGADSVTDSGNRTALTTNKVALQVQALLKETPPLRPQQRLNTLRGARDASDSDRIVRPDGSPSVAARLAKEVTKKGTKADAKQRSSGAAKEIRWPCGGERRSGGKQQTDARHAAGTGNVPGLWGTFNGTVDGTPDAHAPKTMPADAGRAQQGTALHVTAPEGTPGLDNCGDLALSSHSISGTNAPSASQMLQPGAGPLAKSSRRPHGAPPLKGYGDDASGLRRGAAIGHTEIKFSFGASSALLQMPVAVSTVSTALSSATASDFCNGQSQPTDVAGEAGAWRHEPQHLSTEGASKGIAKAQEIQRLGRQEGEISLDATAPERAGPKQSVTVDGLCKQTSDRDGLRRDAPNACYIQ